MPLYLSLTEGMNKGEAAAFAKRASVAAFAAMLALAFGGNRNPSNTIHNMLRRRGQMAAARSNDKSKFGN
jgi:hypothetical protein